MSARADILLVGVPDSDLAALEAILPAPAFRLVRARSERDALRELRANDFALVLLDLAPPELYERAVRLRHGDRSRDTALIFIAAECSSDLDLSRGYAAGAVDYIFKPFDVDLLRSKVAVWTARFRQHAAVNRRGEALQRAHDQLEQRMASSTRELKEANDALRAEIAASPRRTPRRPAATAASALERFRGRRPDVLVSDIAMPDQDGYELIRTVRRLPIVEAGRTPAIALTAYVREEDVGRALAAGFDRHIRKPVPVVELIQAVAELAVAVPPAEE